MKEKLAIKGLEYLTVNQIIYLNRDGFLRQDQSDDKSPILFTKVMGYNKQLDDFEILIQREYDGKKFIVNYDEWNKGLTKIEELKRELKQEQFA